MVEAVIDWRVIPEMADVTAAPFDGEPYLVYADSATVDVVRLAYWREPTTNPCDDDEVWEGGWWSDRHSVTCEHLSFLNPTHWAPFNAPLSVTRCP